MIGLSLKYTYQRALTDPETGLEVVKTVALQDTLDGILPKMLPIVFVGFCYWLLKKKVSPVRVILIVAVVAFVLGALGVMG